MGVLHDASGTGSVSGAPSSFNIPLTIAPNPDRYLLVHLFQWDSGTSNTPSQPTALTWNGVQATKLWEIRALQYSMECWGIPNPAAMSGNVTITTSNSWTRRAASASAYYNVDPTTPIASTFTPLATSTVSATVAKYLLGLGTAVAGDLAVAALGTFSGATNTLLPVNGVPKYLDSGTAGQAATGTSRTPANVSAASRGIGVTHMALVATKNGDTHNCVTAGWTKFDQWIFGTSLSVSLWYNRQPTAAQITAPVVTWTNSAANFGQQFSYTDANADASPPLALLGPMATGTIATHDTVGANAAFAKSLALYMDVCAANTAVSTPVGWTEDLDQALATAVARFGLGSKPIANAGDASGAISITGGAAAWIQTQLELRAGSQQIERANLNYGTTTFWAQVSVCEEAAAAYHAFGWNAAATTSGYYGGLVLKAAPVVAVTLTASRFDAVQEFYGPKLRAALSVAFHTNPQAFYAPKIKATIKSPFHQNTQAFYAPSITAAAPPNILKPPLFTVAQAFYAPTLKFNLRLSVPLHTNTQAFYGPALYRLQKLVAPFHQNQQVFFDHAITRAGKVFAPFHQNPQAFYGPTIITPRIITLARHNNPQAFYAPTLRFGLVTKAPFFQNTQAFFGPTLRMTVKTVRFDNQQAFYAPRLRATIKPTLHTNPQQFFGPTLRFAPRLNAPFHQNTQQFFGPTVKTPRLVTAPFYSNVPIIYAPKILFFKPPIPPEPGDRVSAIGPFVRMPGDPKPKPKREPVVEWQIKASSMISDDYAPPWNPVVVTPELDRRAMKTHRLYERHVKAARAKHLKREREIDNQIIKTVIDILKE